MTLRNIQMNDKIILLVLTLASALAFVLAITNRVDAASAAVTITVDSAGDTDAADGVCSLREAITAANNNATHQECIHDGTPGTDTIAFAIGALGSRQTITLTANLPTIIEPVVLDGWSQGGGGYKGPPLIELNGENLTSSAARGFRIDGGGTTVRGFVINRFAAPSGAGITLRRADGNWILGNYIGLSADGTAAMPNYYGIWIDNWGNDQPSNDNIIGTNGDGIDDVFEGNVIAGNSSEEIRVETTGNLIAGNFIGTDASGSIALSSNGTGIPLHGDNNVIGTDGDGLSDDLEGNVISGNSVGISIHNSRGHRIAGNIIGLDLDGDTILGNEFNGIECDASATDSDQITIGSNNDGVSDHLEGNVISGNGTRGYSTFSNDCRHITISRNKIGTDVTGTVALGNGSEGLIISAGDWYTVTHNVISGNGTNGMAAGVYLGNGANQITLFSNIIGADATGTIDLGNTGEGVRSSFSNDEVIAYNQISGNGGYGILSTGSSNLLVEGNLIGVQAGGESDLGNGSDGVYIHGDSADHTLHRNVIAFNGANGVVVDGPQATGHTLRRNMVHANNDLGIDLDGDGVSANDSGDGDAGPNGLQNYPAIDLAESTVKGQAVISGTLDSVTDTTFTLDFFYSLAADPSGFGEGRVYVGSGLTTTDGSGDSNFQFTFDRTLPPNAHVTATATDPAGNTSEFSAAYGPVSGILDDPISGLSAACNPASCETIAGAALELTSAITGGTGAAYAWDLGDGWTAWGQSITHTYTTPGTYTATVRATNNDSAQSAAVLVTVLSADQPPVADAGPNQTVTANSMVTLDGTGSLDPAGNLPLEYAWTQTSGASVSLSDPAAAQPTFTAPVLDAVLSFELVVTNSVDLASSPDTVTVAVEAQEIYLPTVIR